MGPGVTTLPARYNPGVSPQESPASVEREIAALSRKLDSARAELAWLRTNGPSPRGWFAGILAGMVLVVVAFAGFAWWVSSNLHPPINW
jgi:hypothetical protein